MLTTYLFRYTSDYTISQSNFQKNFASGGKGALTPLPKILRTFLDTTLLSDSFLDTKPFW